MNIATGCMASLGMKHHVRDTGRAGMEQLLSSYAQADYFIMKLLTAAIGPMFVHLLTMIKNAADICFILILILEC